MPQKLPVNNFDWIEVGVQYIEKLHELHHDLPFLPERMKTENVEKLIKTDKDGNESVATISYKIQFIDSARFIITYLHNKTEYVIHIRHLKQALNYGLVLKKVHRGIKFNQKA